VHEVYLVDEMSYGMDDVVKHFVRAHPKEEVGTFVRASGLMTMTSRSRPGRSDERKINPVVW